MERIGKPRGDALLLLILIVTLGVGISVLFSASTYYAQRMFQDPYYLFRRQLLWVVLGSVAGVTASQVPITTVRQATPIVVASALILTVLTFVPRIGRPIMGARRWLFVFGQSFEPSELVKFSIVLYLAAIFSKKQDRINDPVNSLLPPLLVVSLFVALIYLQNDFSTAFFILLIALAMFLIAQVRILFFLLLSLLFVPLGGMLLFTKAHRVRRLMAFLNPLADPSGSGYQVSQLKAPLLAAVFGAGDWARELENWEDFLKPIRISYTPSSVKRRDFWEPSLCSCSFSSWPGGVTHWLSRVKTALPAIWLSASRVPSPSRLCSTSLL